MERLKDPKIQGQLRHLLTSLGPLIGVLSALVANDAITWGDALTALTTNWTAVVGVAMALLAFWASWTAKEKRNG